MLLAAVWLAAGPATADLAAQVHRVGAFAAHGFAVWDNSWYAGHHLPGYSLVFPAVGATIGVRLAGAVAAVVSAVIFDRLVGARWPASARWWFAVGCAADLLIGRLTYALGLAAGLAAIAALVRGHRVLATALAVACAATSPVAGLFLALAGLAVAWQQRRWAGAMTGAVALATVVALGTAFPEGGTQPFSGSSFAVTAAIVAAATIVVAPVAPLRRFLLLYLAAVVVSFVVPSPMGGNVIRLGTAFVGPALLAAAPSTRQVRRVALVVVLAAAAAWQWVDPFTQAAHGWDDPSSDVEYFAPLQAQLARAGEGAMRVEVPFTRGHWETVYLARDVALARGWERQLDRRLNPLFYGRALDADAYHRWLRANAVAYVALPDAPLDTAGRLEAALVRRRPPYLQWVWSSAHWQLFRVRDALKLASPRASGVRLSETGVVVDVRRPGRVLLRVHWTPYWQVASGGGRVERAGPWTLLWAPRPGPVVLTAQFSLGRLLQ